MLRLRFNLTHTKLQWNYNGTVIVFDVRYCFVCSAHRCYACVDLFVCVAVVGSCWFGWGLLRLYPGGVYIIVSIHCCWLLCCVSLVSLVVLHAGFLSFLLLFVFDCSWLVLFVFCIQGGGLYGKQWVWHQRGSYLIVDMRFGCLLISVLTYLKLFGYLSL